VVAVGPRLWVSPAALTDAGEVLYEEDLPGCCQRSASSAHDVAGGGSFECPACGASWEVPVRPEPEECAFTERPADRERRGAA